MLSTMSVNSVKCVNGKFLMNLKFNTKILTQFYWRRPLSNWLCGEIDWSEWSWTAGLTFARSFCWYLVSALAYFISRTLTAPEEIVRNNFHTTSGKNQWILFWVSVTEIPIICFLYIDIYFACRYLIVCFHYLKFIRSIVCNYLWS